MTGFLTDLADERRRLLERADRLASVWAEAQDATGGGPSGGGLVDADLARIRADLDRRRFTIGLFGLIKRGKSTLLNALLGSELSPTHVTPETAVPVYVDHGDEANAIVHLASGESREVSPSDVAEWTSQKHNAGNRRGVTHVQWTFPSPLLQNGVRVVDTPGLDDAEADEIYTRRTIQELEAADAGILVFLSPPTVGATEMAFLREVTGAQLRKTLVVANLYPQQFHDGDTRAAVVEYVRTRLVEASGDADVRVHAICAEEAWRARRDGDEIGWEIAGGAELLRALEETIAANTGRQALGRVEAALDRATQVAAAAIDLRVQVLTGGAESEHKEHVQSHRERLDEEGGDLLERRLMEMVGLRSQLQALVHQMFFRTRTSIRDASSVQELEALLARFTREVEVVTEDAFRKLHARLMALHAEVAQEFDAGVAETLHELGAVQPGVQALRADHQASEHTTAFLGRATIQDAAVGGLVGGAGFALVGALLGPVGLVAGALAGWRLGAMVRTGLELRPLREQVDEQLTVVADAVLAEFDRRIDDVVAAVRETARQRRSGFAADLTDTLAILERFAPGSEARIEAIATLRQLSDRVRNLSDDAGSAVEADRRGDNQDAGIPAGHARR